MDKFKFNNIVIISIILFTILTTIYYKKTQDNAIDNAKSKINELLLNYKAFRNYVGTVQKEEIYRLQKEGAIDETYFNPVLLSSTFTVRSVNHLYNDLKAELGEKPVVLRFASDNARNPLNKATKEESKLLKQFNNNEIKEYTKIIENGDETTLYYVLPTKRTTDKCMKCHSDPSIAPTGLIQIYGDKNGFHEKVGEIRAILSTTYPLNDDLEKANKTFYLLTFITLFVFVILLVIVYLFMKKLKKINRTLDDKVTSRTKELLDEKEYIKKILDVNPSIIVVMNNGKIINANKQYFKFFNYKNKQACLNDEKSMEDYFLEFDKELFCADKKINDKSWYDYLVDSQESIHNISIDFNHTINFFIISGTRLNKKGDIVITLQNITDQMEKDKLLFEQSKLASMGEMIGNIAHQWRQPLSIISTSATGMLVQKQYNLLTDEQFEKSCNLIDENAQYLSKTIDDFRNFIKGDREKVNFNLYEHIDIFLQLVNSSIKTYHIEVIKDVNKNIYLDGYTNELVQCFINIFNNAKDVLKDIDENERLFFIKAHKENEKIIISLVDSGRGIPVSVLPRIFEPYFTTKHKSQGTGIGLHMTYNMIVDGMGGKLDAANIEYEYQGKKYKGAEFKITLPIIIK
ncbi:MAG: DUF3365 domain-containing protein [Arcobacteraceae bacterium]